MAIQILSINTINKIAAGEVIDRPLSIVKELVENSIDANSSEITIEIGRGGRNYISVTDNGKGIKKEELSIALERHATSKLDEENINNIQFLGFRGEALPSIGSVSKLKIISKAENSNDAWEIDLIGGKKSNIKPASHLVGTYIKVKDLFFTTPARLKFLKSESSETSACIELVNKLALSRQDISFKLISNEKKIINTQGQKLSILKSNTRISDILGKIFVENTIKFSYEKEEVKVYGYTSIPTFHAATSINQYFFINKRIVKDKVLSIALKAAYRNLIPHNRFPQTILYIDIDSKLVDVNVHPTKAEVRFRDEHKIKGIIIDAIRSAITKNEFRNSTAIADYAVRLFKPENFTEHSYLKKKEQYYNPQIHAKDENRKQKKLNDFIRNHETKLWKETSYSNHSALNEPNTAFEPKKNNEYISNLVKKDITKKLHQPIDEKRINDEYPLGFAKCQIDKTYIVAEKSDYLILVDQHAAHERLTLEKMKQQLKDGKVIRQILLVPKVVNLGQVLTEQVIEKKNKLEDFGLNIERNGISQILVRQIPAILQNIDINGFMKNIAENIYLFDDINLIESKIEEIWGNIACYSSIRSGRVLSIEEMNALLREMENTPLSEQCNHGRPTFVKLHLKDIRKIFERS